MLTLGHYTVLEPLPGEGGVEVYRARDTRLGRTVELKVLPQSLVLDAERRARFLREAADAGRLSHPNIAVLYEVGEDQGRLFLVFEFMAGQALGILVAGRPLNPRRAIDLGAEIADALAEAHAANLAHGALTADTVVVTSKGRVKILDFGLTEWTGRGGRPTSVDERSDVTALGILLFQMLTGKLPDSGPLTPSVVNPAVPRDLDPVVMNAIRKSPDRGYESAATLAAELRSVGAALDARLEHGPVTAPAVVATSRVPALWLIVVSLLSAAGAVAYWMLYR